MTNSIANSHTATATSPARARTHTRHSFSQKSIDEKRTKWNAEVRKELEELRRSRERYEKG